MMKSYLKLLSASVVLGLSIHANANSMEGVFNELNGTATYGEPVAIQSQTMNYYHGGNITLATPTRNYNLVAAQAPNINAGCGGIDLHMGGFSFISKEQFVQLLRNIGSNALGYGFKIALQNICPTCDNVMTSLQNVADRINQFNINSCQAAKGIVNAAANEVFNTQYDTKVMDWGMIDGIYRDGVDAYRNVKNVFNKDMRKEALEDARKRNPSREEELPTGNVTWNALGKIQGISEIEKRRFMGLIGTVVFDADGTVTPYIPRDPMITRKIIRGDASNFVQMQIPTCQNSDCTKMNWQVFETSPSFKKLVISKMQTMQQHISQRKPYPNSIKNEVLAFVNATDIPVYKIVALTASLNNQGIGDITIEKYSELIAAKYAQTYISTAARNLRNTLDYMIAKESKAAQVDAMKMLIGRIDELEKQLAMDVEQLYNSAQTSFIVAQEVKMLENTMISNMTSTIANSLEFGNSLK